MKKMLSASGNALTKCNLPYLETARRTEIVKELWATEKTYVTCLKALVDVYLKPLRSNAETIGITRQDIKGIFSEIEVIMNYNTMLLGLIEARITAWSEEQTVGDIFLKIVDFLSIYPIRQQLQQGVDHRTQSG